MRIGEQEDCLWSIQLSMAVELQWFMQSLTANNLKQNSHVIDFESQ